MPLSRTDSRSVSPTLADLDVRLGRVRMPRDVRQRLLHHAVQRDRGAFVERRVALAQPHRHLDAHATRRVARQPFDRRIEPEVVEHQRPQVGRDAAHRGDGLVEQSRASRRCALPRRAPQGPAAGSPAPSSAPSGAGPDRRAIRARCAAARPRAPRPGAPTSPRRAWRERASSSASCLRCVTSLMHHLQRRLPVVGQRRQRDLDIAHLAVEPLDAFVQQRQRGPGLEHAADLLPHRLRATRGCSSE